MLPKSLPAKTVVQNVRTENLAEKRPTKLPLKWRYWYAGQKMYSQKQTFKMSVLKC